MNIQSRLSGPCDKRVADTNTSKFQHVIAQEHRKQRRSTSQESDGLSGLDLSNIIIPNHEVTSEGPLYETHDGLLPRSKRLKVLRHANTPPGPDALTALRDRIPPHLLYQLPDLVSMGFEDHAFSKPGNGIHYTRLRLLVGIYSDNETAKQEGKVWAYLKPRLNQNNQVAPTIEMILEEDHRGRGIRNEVQIAWTTDIQPGLVSLAPIFAQIINDAQLKAVVKYGFLLAEDAKLFGYGRYCVPVNTALVTHLTKLCDSIKLRVQGPVSTGQKRAHAGRKPVSQAQLQTSLILERNVIPTNHRRARTFPSKANVITAAAAIPYYQTHPVPLTQPLQPTTTPCNPKSAPLPVITRHKTRSQIDVRPSSTA
ncbi:hypothetical protein N0V95_006526 [Ascochyta clinopodiicola]|nr:hypothetical protein N0V95_006526 [Ascochyta clinopodiicola]